MRRQIYLNKLHIPGFEPFASGYKPAEAGCRVFEPFASGYKTAETGIVAALRRDTYLLSEKQFKCHK